jgi:type IV secretion system protein VirD4
MLHLPVKLWHLRNVLLQCTKKVPFRHPLLKLIRSSTGGPFFPGKLAIFSNQSHLHRGRCCAVLAFMTGPELREGDKRHQIRVLVVLDEFASLSKCSVLASAFSYVAGYGLRLLPAFQSLEQIEGVYGEKVVADIRRNCAVRMVLRPADLDDAKKISERLGTHTFRARSRSMGSWGRGVGVRFRSTSRAHASSGCRTVAGKRSDRLPARLSRRLRQEDPLLCRPETSGPDTYSRTTNATNSARPERGTQKFARYRRCRSGGRKDRNQAFVVGGTTRGSGAASAGPRLNQAAIDAASAAPFTERTRTLFHCVIGVVSASPSVDCR